MPKMNMTDLASILATELQRGLVKHKAETAKEMKTLTRTLVQDALGTGTPGYKALSDLIAKEVEMRIPTAALFQTDKGKGEYDPAKGIDGMSKKSVDELARKTLLAITPVNLRDRLMDTSPLFAGIDSSSRKAMSVGLGSSGGYLLPEEFIPEIQRKLVHESVFLNLCRNWTGVEMQGKMPRETGTVSVTIAGELVTPANTQPTLGQLTWSLQKRIGLTNLPKELWKFSGVDVLNFLSTLFSEQFQKTVDYFYLLGSGSQQPMGLLTNQTGMNTLAISGATVQWQDFFRLKHAIKSQYRNERSSCGFMMNNNTIEIMSTTTDDQNRPVFIDRGSEGMGGPNMPPQTVGFIAGYPVLENPYTPGPVAETLNGTSNTSVPTGSTTATAIFANFKRGYAGFQGPALEVATSDIAYDAFINDGMYCRAIDYIDGQVNIPEAIAILTGIK